jgi:hypothetical protein
VHGPSLWSEVRRTRWRRSEFQVHTGKHRQLDGYAARLGHIAEEHLGPGARQRIVLAYGGGKFASSMAGNPAAPTGQMKQALARQYPLVVVDEAYTLSHH